MNGFMHRWTITRASAPYFGALWTGRGSDQSLWGFHGSVYGFWDEDALIGLSDWPDTLSRAAHVSGWEPHIPQSHCGWSMA